MLLLMLLLRYSSNSANTPTPTALVSGQARPNQTQPYQTRQTALSAKRNTIRDVNYVFCQVFALKTTTTTTTTLNKCLLLLSMLLLLLLLIIYMIPQFFFVFQVFKYASNDLLDDVALNCCSKFAWSSLSFPRAFSYAF